MEGARRGATLTQRLFAFARKQELKAQATDVRSLVEDMIGLIDRSVGPMVRSSFTPKTKCRSSTSTRTSSKWLYSISP